MATINTLRLSSDSSENNGVEIKGLSAKPVDITGFFGQIVGNTVLLNWNRHPDLDVRIGGRIEIRHHNNVAGGNAKNSIVLAGGTVSGDTTFTQVSALVGTYYIRAFDQQGNASGFAEWSTSNVRPVPFAQIISAGAFQANDNVEDRVTLQEDPGWASTNAANLKIVVDNTNNLIKLAPKTFVSSVTANFSTIAKVSEVGSETEVAPEGIYHFATRLELAAVTRMRIEVELQTTIINTKTILSKRRGNVSSYVSFTGDVDPSAATAFVEARFTRDDPNASPTWSPWERVESRIFLHRAIEFRIRLRSFDTAYNIEIRQARVRARELAAAA